MVLKMEDSVEKTTATGERSIGGIMPPRGQVKIYKQKAIHVHMRVHTHTPGRGYSTVRTLRATEQVAREGGAEPHEDSDIYRYPTT